MLLTASSTFKTVIYAIIGILKLLFPILFGVTLIFFFWGLTKFILNSAGSPAEIEKGRTYMLWSILAIFILFTFRAIVGYISNEFDFGPSTAIPVLPTGGNTPDVQSTFNPLIQDAPNP